jgi:predicted HTH domain antitoxin
MVRMTIEVSEGALASLRQDPQGFAGEMRLAAAVKWYELRLVSQGRAAEIAGLSRSEFIDALGRFEVSPFQYGIDELVAEAGTD